MPVDPGLDAKFVSKAYLAPKVHLDPDHVYLPSPLPQGVVREAARGQCLPTCLLEIVQVHGVVDVPERIQFVWATGDPGLETLQWCAPRDQETECWTNASIIMRPPVRASLGALNAADRLIRWEGGPNLRP